MKIGDKVRLLHGKEEGIIRKIKDNRIVEIEIEDGFLIPVLKNEVVPVASGELEGRQPHSSVSGQKPSEITGEEKTTNRGVFLAMEEKGNTLSGWIINNTAEELLFTVHDRGTKNYKGVASGNLNAYSYAKIDDWTTRQLSHLPQLRIDLLYFNATGETYTPPLSRDLDIGLKVLNTGKQKIPLLSSKGILIKLTEDTVSIDPEALKEAFFNKETIIPHKEKKPQESSRAIDLHIEALFDEVSNLDAEDILRIQLEYFEKSLDKAVAEGLNDITFIHGLGNGILRQKIHKFLSQYPHIRYFEDAMKEKFGFGATKVYLK